MYMFGVGGIIIAVIIGFITCLVTWLVTMYTLKQQKIIFNVAMMILLIAFLLVEANSLSFYILWLLNSFVPSKNVILFVMFVFSLTFAVALNLNAHQKTSVFIMSYRKKINPIIIVVSSLSLILLYFVVYDIVGNFIDIRGDVTPVVMDEPKSIQPDIQLFSDRMSGLGEAAESLISRGIDTVEEIMPGLFDFVGDAFDNSEDFDILFANLVTLQVPNQTQASRERLRDRAIELLETMNDTNANITALWEKADLLVKPDNSSSTANREFLKIKEIALGYKYGAPQTDPTKMEVLQSPEVLRRIISALDWMKGAYKIIEGRRIVATHWLWLEAYIPRTLGEIFTILWDDTQQNPEMRNLMEYYFDVADWYQPDPQFLNYRYNPDQIYDSPTGGNRTDAILAFLFRNVLRRNEEKIRLSIERLNDSAETVAGLLTPATGFELIGFKDNANNNTFSRDGIYFDGSSITHRFVPLPFSYGRTALGGIQNIVNVVKDTKFDLSLEQKQALGRILETAYINTMVNGLACDWGVGRAIMSEHSDDYIGYQITDLLIRLSNYLLETKGISKDIVALREQAERVKRIAIGWRHIHEDAFGRALPSLVKDDPTPPLPEPAHTQMFAGMDIYIHKTQDWCFTVGMSSTRMMRFEIINTATASHNLEGWYMSEGTNYLYLKNEPGQYRNGFFISMDRFRWMGSTVDARRFGDEARGFGNWLTPEYFVGGTSLKESGTAAMTLNRRDGNETENRQHKYQIPAEISIDLEAKKSWFMYSDFVLCMGSGIMSTGEDERGNIEPRITNAGAETIVMNRRLVDSSRKFELYNQSNTPIEVALFEELPAVNSVTVGSQVAGLNPPLRKADNIRWAYIEGNSFFANDPGADEKNSIGMYFPGENGQTVYAIKNKRKDWGPKVHSNNPNKYWENTYATLLLKHDAANIKYGGGTGLGNALGAGASYEYVVLPAHTKEQIITFTATQESKNPRYTVLSRTDDLHAVVAHNENIHSYIFWDNRRNPWKPDESRSYTDLRGLMRVNVYQPTIVMTQKGARWFDVSISDPEHLADFDPKKTDVVEIGTAGMKVTGIDYDSYDNELMKNVKIDIDNDAQKITFTFDVNGLIGRTLNVRFNTNV